MHAHLPGYNPLYLDISGAKSSPFRRRNCPFARILSDKLFTRVPAPVNARQNGVGSFPIRSEQRDWKLETTIITMRYFILKRYLEGRQEIFLSKLKETWIRRSWINDYIICMYRRRRYIPAHLAKELRRKSVFTCRIAKPRWRLFRSSSTKN